MAHVGPMQLVEPNAPPTSGAAFYLNEAAKNDAVEIVDGTRVVEIKNGSRFVVTRGGTETSYEEARNRALSVAQRGLDFFSITGASDRAIVDPENEHICWWIEPSGVVLRHVNQLIHRFHMSATGTVLDAAGNPLPPATTPPRVWNESYRYFRLSQVTDDLFDAYRNLFLALESLVSSFTPKIPSESEKDWLTRAFRGAEANGLITLANFAAPGIADPLQDIIRDIYGEKRTALFHAKQNRAVLLPHDATQRSDVTQTLIRLSRIYLELVRTHFHTTRGSSRLSDYAFQQMPMSDHVVNVTDDVTPLVESDLTIYREGRQLVALATREAVELNEPYLRNILGNAPSGQVSGLNGIFQILIATPEGTLVAWYTLPDKLDLDGTERFEVLLRVRMVNREAKRFYGM